MLSIDGVQKTYPNGVQALGGVAFTVPEGEIVALIGGSGCGKSTLLRLAAGLDMPTRGAIAVDGTAIAAPHPSVGIVFQEARLLPWLTVGDNVAFGIDSLPRAERRDRVDRVLERVGLADYRDRWPRELSGGQAQRVAIARALVAGPKVLLLDEPFSALDAFTRASLQDALLALWEATRPTLVIVTHDVDEAIVLADRVLVMQPHPGRIFAEIAITMPRPRDRLSDDFVAAGRRVMRALDGSLNIEGDARAAAREADAGAGAWW